MKWISDSGHGWLAVNLSKYPDAINYGTGYGYIDGNHAYLEEDCEASAFLSAHPEIDPATLPVARFVADWFGRSKFDRIPANYHPRLRRRGVATFRSETREED